MSDIVLVHGTTQTSAGFAALVAHLRDRGHRAHAVDLPSTAATTVDYADLIAAQLPADLGRPVIVAHSAAGLLLPALSRRLDASHQIWLAAAVADYTTPRSLLAEMRASPDEVMQSEWQGIDPTSDPVLATYFLLHDADLATLRSALPTISLTDLSPVYDETPTEDPTAIPSTYLLPTQDRTLQPTWMQHIARERLHTEPLLLPGGHNCYTAHPAAAATAIDDAIERHR